ncbi:tryptophan dimethylallyltransferase-domain-containing protein [Aspergillus aurantiobrunneus]
MRVNDNMAVRGADALQFELLDKYMSCPVDSQREWWQKTGPLLASLKSSAGYTDRSQFQYLMFFYTAIVPYLGPYPQRFPSAMTHNELPLELSINFQQLGGARPVIRVAVEPITCISGTKDDPYNLSPILEFLDRLEKLNPEGYDSRLFKHFYPKHILDRSQCQKLQAKQEAIRELSQVAFGFDLKPNGISVKGYTFPTLKCHAAGKDLCSVVLGSVQEGLEYLRLLWDLLHIGDAPHPLGLHLVWNYETKAGLTVPATKIYFPVYGLNDQNNVRAIAQYLTQIGLDVHGNAYEQAARDCL